MNKNVTSRQELIDAAMEISRTEGVHKVNIRNIAKKCSISVGVLYNYFPTKTDLIFAVVEGLDGCSAHPDRYGTKNSRIYRLCSFLI